MTNPQPTFEQLRALAHQARRAGRYAKAAGLERQAVEMAEIQGLEGQRIRALLWEGYCLRQIGDHDLASAILMQAANSHAPEADPADIFYALTALIHIALARKSAAFNYKLLAEARDYLDNLGKPQWRHMLDFLAGELEYARGDMEAAWRHYRQAWEIWQESYPYFTAASHLWALCQTAFRRQDRKSLSYWVETIESRGKNHELEKILAKRARLLLFRAQRTDGEDFVPAADLALAALDTLDLFEIKKMGAVRDCLRVLALAGRWQALDQTLADYPLGEDFQDYLCQGDLALCRARANLGMALQDDEYDSALLSLEFDITKPAAALTHLATAAACYRAAEVNAQTEDQRLKTQWYNRMLTKRLEWVEAISCQLKCRAVGRVSEA